MPVLPMRKPVEAAPTDTEPAAEAPVTQETPVETAAPEDKAPAKKGPPKKAAKAAPKKTAQKAAPKKGPAKKEAKEKHTKGPKAAVERTVPTVKPLKTKACSDDQLFIWEIIHVMRVTKPVIGHQTKRLEIRWVDDRSIAFLCGNIKELPPKGCYTLESETKEIVKFLKQYVPEEMAGKKWGKFLFA